MISFGLLSQYFLYLLIRYKNLPKHFAFKKILLRRTQAHQISNIIFAMNANIIVTQKDALHASNSSTTCLGENGIPTHFEILNVSFDACYLPRDKRMLDFVFMKCVSLTKH